MGNNYTKYETSDIEDRLQVYKKIFYEFDSIFYPLQSLRRLYKDIYHNDPYYSHSLLNRIINNQLDVEIRNHLNFYRDPKEKLAVATAMRKLQKELIEKAKKMCKDLEDNKCIICKEPTFDRYVYLCDRSECHDARYYCCSWDCYNIRLEMHKRAHLTPYSYGDDLIITEEDRMNIKVKKLENKVKKLEQELAIEITKNELNKRLPSDIVKYCIMPNIK